jgi:hypothetical protein
MDQAHAKKKKVSVSKESVASPDEGGSVGATNVGVIYQASTGVGTPPTECERCCFKYDLRSETGI